MEDLLRVGVITSTHGLAGEVKVYPTTDEPMRFKKCRNYILKTEKETFPVEVTGVKFFKNMVILKMKEFCNINEVQPYLSAELYVTRENALPLKEGEYYICDLIGLTVEEDATRRRIGVITDVIKTAANDVYEITDDQGKKYLFPVIPECILKVDLAAKTVTAHVMKGLLDL